MSKKIYTVLSPVDHDNERFEIGSPIDLDDKQAAELLLVNAIGPTDGGAAPAPAAGPAPAVAPADETERLEAIKAAIAGFDKDNADLWLKDGKPATEAIAEITGWPVTAADRNTAWAALTA